MKTKKYEIESPIGLLELEVYPKKGFTIWCTEDKTLDGKANNGHWLVDGSCLDEDGAIRLGEYRGYQKDSVYSRGQRTIRLIKKPLKNISQ